MAKTRFRGFSVKKLDFQGPICKKPGTRYTISYVNREVYV
jgi:hypothetical protein